MYIVYHIYLVPNLPFFPAHGKPRRTPKIKFLHIGYQKFKFVSDIFYSKQQKI